MLDLLPFSKYFINNITNLFSQGEIKMNHLNERILNKVKERLWEVNSSLKGIASLFQKESGYSVCIEADEFFGIGTFLKKQAEELSILEDILNCGYDSMANKRNGIELIEENLEEE